MKDLPKVYLVRAGSNGEHEDYALEHGLAIIGFIEFGSLEGCKTWEDLLAFVREAQPQLKPRQAGNRAGRLWPFAFTMKEGDTVVLPRKLTSQVALGKVTRPYKYLKVGETHRHTRAVKWIRPDVPRATFRQDLLNSFGAFMTGARNDAERRVAEVLAGKPDPGPFTSVDHVTKNVTEPTEDEAATRADLWQLAHDQIIAHIQSKYSGHGLTKLVDAVLKADGWVSKVSPPGADGGVGILAGWGALGLDQRLCVQVKSQLSPADVTVYRGLQGSMQSFKAEQGLLVWWGGFNRAVQSESKQGHFSVRLWQSTDLVRAIRTRRSRRPRHPVNREFRYRQRRSHSATMSLVTRPNER